MVKYLKLTSVKILARKLNSTPQELTQICDEISEHDEHSTPKHYYEHDKPDKKGKNRHYSTPIGRLRDITNRLANLLQQINYPDYVKGGVKGQDYIKNAKCHRRKHFLMRIDLKSFYPNISHVQVYRMFLEQQKCSKPVATILTRLTTIHKSVPQGSPTSTLVATLTTIPLTKRLHTFAQSCGVTFTQYIDDFLFSGPESFTRRDKQIVKIIEEEGFFVNPDKIEKMSKADEQIATGVRVNNDLDAPQEKYAEIKNVLALLTQDVEAGKEPTEKILMSVKGSIQHIKQFNKGAARHFTNKLHKLTKQ